MKIGIALPQLGPQATPENLIRVAEHAEQLGYDSAWVLERMLWPTNPKEPYPATRDGRLPETYKSVLDPLETLTFVAAHTRRLGLGTSVLVLPYHNPVQLARRIATLDVLSKGRAMVGVGVGWSHDEFEAAGTPFARRGARADEFLRAMTAIWTQDPVGFAGEFYRFSESAIGPKPVQKPRPPIYVGGYGDASLERAVQLGDGWNPSGNLPFEWFEKKIQRLGAIAAREGKAPMEVVLRATPKIFENSTGGKRQLLMGTMEEIKGDVYRLRDLGITQLIFSPPEIGFTMDESIDAGLATMEQLMQTVR